MEWYWWVLLVIFVLGGIGEWMTSTKTGARLTGQPFWVTKTGKVVVNTDHLVKSPQYQRQAKTLHKHAKRIRRAKKRSL